MDLAHQIALMGRQACAAARQLALLSSHQKDEILLAMARALEDQAPQIVEANQRDLDAAAQKGMANAMLDRLRLDPAKVFQIANAVRKVASLPDPVGEIISSWQRPNGIQIEKRRTPIGVIGIIFESRPNVTSDAASLCLKAGNATILRGGSEAFHSNSAIAAALASGGATAGMPEGAVQLIPSTDRDAVRILAESDDVLDLIIPRGGKGLIQTVTRLARMPVIKHYDGICHLYVHHDADPVMASSLTLDSKAQKPSVCNALETLLIHRDIAPSFCQIALPALARAGVELRGDPAFCALCPTAIPATEEDWSTEYLDLILSVKLVTSLEEAVCHINTYGSHHTDAIVTSDSSAAEAFLDAIDSATVNWNVSTRFSDGEEFGFGAEIGISTERLHARGPMGLPELTIYKYLVRGDGQTKALNSTL